MPPSPPESRSRPGRRSFAATFAASAPAEPGAPTQDEVRAFLDERVPALMEEHGVPGVGVAVAGVGLLLALGIWYGFLPDVA